jgi:hypothetical protein
MPLARSVAGVLDGPSAHPARMKMGYAEHARRASSLLPSHFIAEGEAARFLRVFRKNRDARVRVLLSIVAPCEGRLDLTPKPFPEKEGEPEKENCHPHRGGD